MPARCRRLDPNTLADGGDTARGAADLEAVFDVPVQVSAVLGRAAMEVGDLLKLGPGTVLELDRKVGEAIDIYVNNRPGRARRGGAGRGQARRDDDGSHQGRKKLERSEPMRLLIVGTLKGQLTTATKIAMDRGAAVTHAESIDQALAVLRSGKGADLLMVDVAVDIRDLVERARARAHPRADRRLRHREQRPRRGRRDPRRRQGIHPAAARSRADRRGARRRRRRHPRAGLARRGDGAGGEARPADRHLRRLGADHRRIRHRQGGAGALRAHPLEPRQEAVHLRQLRRHPGAPARNPSCSATRRARSPARSPAASASSRRRPAARCCSTKSPRWTCGCRPSFCAPSRSASSTASAAPGRCRSTSASSPPRTATWPRPRARANSARTCCSASTSST